MPSSTALSQLAWVRALHTISPTRPCRRAARASDEPIRPIPMSAMRSKSTEPAIG
jgi:hypothetical protein